MVQGRLHRQGDLGSKPAIRSMQSQPNGQPLLLPSLPLLAPLVFPCRVDSRLASQVFGSKPEVVPHLRANVESHPPTRSEGFFLAAVTQVQLQPVAPVRGLAAAVAAELPRAPDILSAGREDDYLVARWVSMVDVGAKLQWDCLVVYQHSWQSSALRLHSGPGD